MRLVKACLAAALVGLLVTGSAWAQEAPPTAHARTLTRFSTATEVQLRDIAAYVRVIPENRSDVAVGFVNDGVFGAPEYRISRRRLIIDGKLRRQIRDCSVTGADGFSVQTARQGRLSGAQLPAIELRVPQSVVLSVSGAVRLNMASAQSARIRLDGCGDADIVGVEDEAEVTIAGSQDVRLYQAGTATVSVAGSGDVVVGAVRDGLTLSIAGSGDFIAARVDGATSIAVQGSGDAVIRDGRATNLSVVIAGGGDVTHNGSAQTLDAVILGGGDVRVHRVDGEISRRVLGGGEVTIGR